MNPFIQTTVLQTLEKHQTKKELLDYIKKRFEETHDTVASWKGDEEEPILHFAYPTKKAFQAAYSWGLGIIDKILQLEQNGFDLNLIQGPTNEEETLDEDEKGIYIPLKNRTNWKSPMRNNYLINRKMAHLLGTNFYAEEIEDGFLMMYKKRVDFEFAQVNRMDLKNVKLWLTKNKIDMNKPSIQVLLEYLRDHSHAYRKIIYLKKRMSNLSETLSSGLGGDFDFGKIGFITSFQNLK